MDNKYSAVRISLLSFHRLFQVEQILYVKLPAFVLTNALWLDAATLCITVLRKIKYNR